MSAVMSGDKTIDAFDGKAVRGLFNKLKESMHTLSEVVRVRTNESLASRITVEKMASSHAERTLGPRDFADAPLSPPEAKRTRFSPN